MPYTEMENITLATLPSYLNGLNAMTASAGTDASGMDGVLTYRRPMSEFC